MSWLCWSDASMFPASPVAPAPPTPPTPPTPGVTLAPETLEPALGDSGPSGPRPTVEALPVDIVIGTFIAPVPPRTATAIIGDPGSMRMADSAERTTVFERTSPKREARGGVGVTRGAVVAT